MDLSLSEAARLLGKTDRQVRYLIQTGKIPAHKKGNRWIVRRDDLPLSRGQVRAAQQKAERAGRLAKEILRPDAKADEEKTSYSVRNLRAYQEGASLYRELLEKAGADHPAAELMREALMLLACGYPAAQLGANKAPSS